MRGVGVFSIYHLIVSSLCSPLKVIQSKSILGCWLSMNGKWGLNILCTKHLPNWGSSTVSFSTKRYVWRSMTFVNPSSAGIFTVFELLDQEYYTSVTQGSIGRDPPTYQEYLFSQWHDTWCPCPFELKENENEFWNSYQKTMFDKETSFELLTTSVYV